MLIFQTKHVLNYFNLITQDPTDLKRGIVININIVFVEY